MKNRMAEVARGEIARLGRDESGIAVMFVLSTFLFIFALCLSVWHYGENVRRKVELQNACDAAAYSAATVQADGLSRMAVINRAMSWSYIQMSKMQMDYITLRWLELTKERYEKDRRNTCPTPLGRLFSHKAGYHTFEHEWKKVPAFIRWYFKHVGIGVDFIFAGAKVKFGFDCKDNTHNKPHEGDGSYIGFRANLKVPFGDNLNAVRLNQPIAGQSDLDSTAKMMTKDEIDSDVASLQGIYGNGGKDLEMPIRAMRNAIATFNALLPLVNRQMATAIEETAVKTLYENLPRDNDGNVDQSILDDYRWTVAGGVSKPPVQYPSGAGGVDTVNNMMCVIDDSYFSGLKNTEEDEMVFLNMADGLPTHLMGKEVRLMDYFADEDAMYRQVTASGLDQWFIRCDPAESAQSQWVKIDRDFSTVPHGIVRAYKNANYEEGKSAASELQKLFGKAFDGIHRGNYVTDFSFTPETQSIRNAFNSNLSSHVHVTKKPKRKWLHPKKYIKHKVTKAVRDIAQSLDGPFRNFINPVSGTLNRVCNLVDKLAGHLCKVDIEPSCVNDRMRFIDQCSNVRNTTGLVSEYEWASAYWFCNWGEIEVKFMGITGKFKWCIHPFLPMAALHGGRKDAKPTEVIHTGGEKGTDSYVDDWKELFGLHQLGIPGLWLKEEYRMFARHGHSRDKYRSTFIAPDADVPLPCEHNTWWYMGIGGKRSGYLLKGFVRIYGDDRAVYNGLYAGVPARPWVLNEKYFRGGGSIIVGVARKQRNVFDWLEKAGASLVPPSLYSAFSPAEGRDQYFTAISAARAGYAPRTGVGRAEGTDSVNNGISPMRRFEVRYDSVTDKTLGPHGHPVLPDAKGLESSVRQQLEERARIGCVCGARNTTERLCRQWNLSQTDWDAVLLPLRHSYARHGSYDSSKPKDTEWDFLGSLSGGDSTELAVGGLLFGQAKWRPFRNGDDFEKKTLKTEDVIPLPEGDAMPASLFRRRRIL